jgi:Na+-translocating ferredoxin:NAD+ oxidoreductase RNF subunit RnfB
MSSLTHGFTIREDGCDGCMSCMRACPTHAIRVKDGKARYAPDRCIDCGTCLTACPRDVITATTSSVEDLGRFRFKVAVPSPVLFGQFPAGITPAHITEGLRALGFDAIWNYAAEVSLVSRAIHDYVENWKGAFPLISISCPVVVRLLQVSYPRMVDQLIRVQPPREIAGREVKRRYSEQLGLSRDEIAAIYITPCQAKTISILQPAEGGESHLDGALGISDVYNAIVACANLHRNEDGRSPPDSTIRNSTYLRWPMSESLSQILSPHRYLSVTGLSNVMQVFNDIEKGKLKNVEFLEAYNCWSGCSGGNLTVANVYLTLSRFHSLISQLPEMDPETEAEVERRYPREDLALEAPIRPRPVRGSTGSLKERVRIVQEAEALLQTLPGLDCGLCGAPTCRELARDISMGDATKAECPFFSRDRLRQLRRLHLRQARS